MNMNKEDPNPNPDHDNAADDGSQSRPNIPLVKLKLENITYHPITKDYAISSDSSSSESMGIINKLQMNLNRNRNDSKKTDMKQAKHKPLLSRKTILNNVTPPPIEPYKLQAWMGPSGSGKTSLLSIASGMTEYDPDSFGSQSKITINNDPHNLISSSSSQASKGFPKGLAGIVWQDDLLLSYLTVRETIAFAARLKIPIKEKHTVDTVVDKVLEDLGLSHVQHSLIGSSTGVGSGGPAGRGISGGERKRCAVASELVTRPPLIFLDEPTSGLDSTSALDLILTLKELANKGGHAIVTVIHQPRTTIFDQMDGLLLLSRGEEVYSGPPSGVRGVLESCPMIGFDLPDQTNIADWIMDLIIKDENRAKSSANASGVGLISADQNGDANVDLDVEASFGSPSSRRILPRHWANIKALQETDHHLTIDSSDSSNFNISHRLVSLAEIQNGIPKYTASFTTQLRMLTRRAVKQTRGEKISKAAIVATTSYIIFESAFWFRLQDNTNYIYERNSLIFFMIIAQANGIVFSSVPMFRRDQALMRRERSKKMYRVLPYFIAKTTADMTTTILLPLIQALIVYWTTNLRPSPGAFFMFGLIYYLTLTAAQGLGLFISAAIPSLQVALIVTPALVIFLLILSGFYIPFPNMPPWISWSKWFSFATYGYSGLLVNEFSGRDIPCADEVNFQIGESNVCPRPGDDVLTSLGMVGFLSSVWFNVGMLVVLQVVFRVAAYVLLRRSP